MASICKAIRGCRAAGALACAGAVAALLAPGPAAAQRWQHVDVSEAPSIAGVAQVGAALTAQGGAWTPPEAEHRYVWFRCPTATWSFWTCSHVGDAPTYTLGAGDQGEYMFVLLYARDGRDFDFEVSAPTAQVAAPPAPAPTPTPAPSFDVPVKNLGAVLNASAKNRRIMRPFPVVRVRGRLTADGARVSLFSVRGPGHVRIAVSCAGRGCPAKRWRRTTHRRGLTRIGAFERYLPAGTRLVIRITRRGYVGKYTTIAIRRGHAPSRLDRCLSPRGTRIGCPR